jgi:hypothetical protein
MQPDFYLSVSNIAWVSIAEINRQGQNHDMTYDQCTIVSTDPTVLLAEFDGNNQKVKLTPLAVGEATVIVEDMTEQGYIWNYKVKVEYDQRPQIVPVMYSFSPKAQQG